MGCARWRLSFVFYRGIGKQVHNLRRTVIGPLSTLYLQPSLPIWNLDDVILFLQNRYSGKHMSQSVLRGVHRVSKWRPEIIRKWLSWSLSLSGSHLTWGKPSRLCTARALHHHIQQQVSPLFPQPSSTPFHFTCTLFSSGTHLLNLPTAMRQHMP